MKHLILILLIAFCSCSKFKEKVNPKVTVTFFCYYGKLTPSSNIGIASSRSFTVNGKDYTSDSNGYVKQEFTKDETLDIRWRASGFPLQLTEKADNKTINLDFR